MSTPSFSTIERVELHHQAVMAEMDRRNAEPPASAHAVNRDLSRTLARLDVVMRNTHTSLMITPLVAGGYTAAMHPCNNSKEGRRARATAPTLREALEALEAALEARG